MVKQQMQQTEIGEIPEDWDLVQLKNIVDQSKAIRYGIVQPGNYDPYGRFMIRGQDYSESKGWAKPLEVFRVSDKIEIRYKNARVKTGDLIMTIVGYCGHVEIIPNWLNGANLTQTTVRISIDSLKAVNKFCKYQLQSSFGKVQVSKYLKGAAQPGLNCGDVENFYLALPSKKEQQAIAQALFETDELLQKLDEFIIKKKNLKKGAMQELLTGKKRLKGFTEEWEETILGDVSDIKTGGKNNEDKVDDGKYPFFVRSQTVEKINSYSYDGEAILIPGEGGIGSIFHYINGKFDVHQRVYKISNFSKKILGKLVYYYMLQNFNKHAMKNSVKATVDSLRLPTFQEFKMHLPKDEKEQQAITEVMDNLNLEIQELEQKKDKYKMIKEGMMQQLLTGKIRLKWEK